MSIAAIAAVAFAVWSITRPSTPAGAPATPSAHVTPTVPSLSPSASATAIEDASQTPDPVAALDAAETAAEAVIAYCSPTLGKSAWMAALGPLLTDAARVAYGTVDPSTVPCSTYAGGAVALDADAYTVRVRVPTDAGPYEALVTRETTTSAWLVDRMVPPQ